jgi:hypothetical protein
MAIDSSSEIGLFHEFLLLRSSHDMVTGSLDSTIQEFRRYQAELSKLRTELQVGFDQCNRGEVKPLDAESIKAKLRERLAQRVMD